MNTDMDSERRQRRSENKEPAITFQLEHIHREFGLHAIVVGNSDGYLVAGSRNDGTDDAVAAYVTAIGTASPDRRRVLINKLYDEQYSKQPNLELRVREFRIGGERAYLGMLGSPRANFAHAGERAVSGVQRIYQTA